MGTPGTPSSTGFSCNKSIEGASSGAPTRISARISCPSHGADETHVPHSGALAIHSLMVWLLELAYSSCGVPGLVSSGNNHGNAATNTTGGWTCATNSSGHLICSSAQRTRWLLRPPLFSPRNASCWVFPMGSKTLSAPSLTTITAARGRASPQGRVRCYGQVWPSYLYKFNYLCICNLYISPRLVI
jgi:hypothetical protein